MTGTWERIHDAALTRHQDGGAELARLVIEADDPFQDLAAERDEAKARADRLERQHEVLRQQLGKLIAALQEQTDD